MLQNRILRLDGPRHKSKSCLLMVETPPALGVVPRARLGRHRTDGTCPSWATRGGSDRDPYALRREGHALAAPFGTGGAGPSSCAVRRRGGGHRCARARGVFRSVCGARGSLAATAPRRAPRCANGLLDKAVESVAAAARPPPSAGAVAGPDPGHARRCGLVARAAPQQTNRARCPSAARNNRGSRTAAR